MFIIALMFVVIMVSQNDNNKPQKFVSFDDNPSYITSSPPKTGYNNDIPQKLADNCNSVMYPINPPYVNYGKSKYSDNCDVNKFNSVP